MPLKITHSILEMLATTIAQSSIELQAPPTLEWLHETVNKDYGDQLTEKEKDQLIKIIREKHPYFETEIAMVVSKKHDYERLDSEKLGIFANPNPKSAYFWNRYCESKKSKPVLLQNVNRDTNRILGHMPDPKSAQKFCSIGMVIGDVQAGKTGNYSALINKSADLGYKLIIVFTGVTENLRSQTQERIDEDFIGVASVAGQTNNHDRNLVGVGRASKRRLEMEPLPITDRNQDLKSTTSATNIQLQAVTSPVIIVTKKNVTLLKHLLKWLKRQESEIGAGVDSPVLIIDDEADNASVNTGKEDEEPKAVNRGIREVLNYCNRVSYVAYTATPFANVFIDPDSSFDNSGLVDLYPKDFIVAIQAPPNYCGGKVFYYDNLDSDNHTEKKRYISDAESFFPLNHKSTDIPSGLPPSLKKALHHFFICCAIRDIRRASSDISERDKHDSCLINVSRFKSYQNSVQSLVEIETNKILSGLQRPNEKSGTVLSNIRKEFESYFVGQRLVPEKWEKVKGALLKIGANRAIQPEVVSINSESADILEYPKDESRRYIAIGGFKLARGFTLEGLTVSYFYRRSKMYDTLMQMARWFGYRDGYTDLVTLWTTKAAAGWYKSITEATEELKSDLVEYEKRKIEPSEFGLRVRSHEVALIITAQNKMRTGTQIKGKIRFDNKLKETFYVDVRPERQLKNTSLSKNFLENLTKTHKFNPFGKKSSLGYFSDVPANQVLDFLQSFEVFCGNSWHVHGLFMQFLERRAESEYSKWDVAFYLPQTEKETSQAIGDRFIAAGQKRNIRILAAKSGISENKFLDEKYSKYELPLGDHRRVSSGSLEAIGLKNMTDEEAIKKITAKELTGKKCRELKAKEGGNPLLAIQLIDIGFIYDDPKKTPDTYAMAEMKRLQELSKGCLYPAYSISLPPSKEEHESDNYIMNINSAKNYFGELESDND